MRVLPAGRVFRERRAMLLFSKMSDLFREIFRKKNPTQQTFKRPLSREANQSIRRRVTTGNCDFEESLFDSVVTKINKDITL